LTLKEKQKRAARNERRGRNAERKSKEPTVASSRLLVGPPGLGRATRSTPSRERAIKAVVEHTAKWKGTPPCDCPRCEHRRKLEEDFKRGKAKLERA
jgi:hypothetical protein